MTDDERIKVVEKKWIWVSRYFRIQQNHRKEGEAELSVRMSEEDNVNHEK